MKELLLVGGGGHCKAVMDVIERIGQWRIVGVVERVGCTLSSVAGYPVLGDDQHLSDLVRPGRFALITVGQIRSPEIRERLFCRVKEAGFELPVIVSTTASVSKSARIGAGTVVMNFAHIGPDACVGDNVIVNTGAVIEHDTDVGNHCHISTGALVNGAVTIADGVFVGSGSVCKEGISLGNRCTIGMGVAVRKNIPDHAIVY